MYTAIVVLHLLSVGVIVGLITSAIIGTAMRKKIAGTPAELAAIKNAATVTPIMANIGSNGLLVTGIIMTLMQWSFFSFSTLPWLAIKQSIFVLILIISFASLMPRGKKILNMAVAELGSPNAAKGASEELRKLVNTQYATTLFVGLLVLCNMILGESKAMMWAAGQ
jgi:hypothetical protein